MASVQFNADEVEKTAPPPPYAGGAPQPTQYNTQYSAPPGQSYNMNPTTQTTYVQGAPPPPPGGMPPQQVVYVNQTGGFGGMQSAIPVMPMWCAITLCIVNILLPGIGTIIGSMTVFCCSMIPQSGSSKMGVFCINFWVGWAQLLTVWLFLIGWIWSIAWGVIFISISASTYSRTATVTQTTTIHQVPVNPQVVTVNTPRY